MDQENIKNPASTQGGEKNIDETSELKKKADEYLNNWKRERADFLNYKKDEVERMVNLANYAKEHIILEVLPILDNIYLAEKQLPEHLKKPARIGYAEDVVGGGEKGSQQAIEWTKGFLQIQKQLEDFLKKQGIEEIKTAGERFNPETMEAVEETSNTQHLTPNTSVEELQKGYLLDGKVLRPAKVKVAK